MRAVVQRVLEASVSIEGQMIAEIGPGLVVLVAVTHADDEAVARALAGKVFGLRILRGERSVADDPDRMSVLVVSQFTLYGDASKGRRPTWSAAAPGALAAPLVAAVAENLRLLGARVQTGRFGADMLIRLANDGPVTVVLEF